MTQEKRIKTAILEYIKNGMTDKAQIYTCVMHDLDVPRPSIRRVVSSLRADITTEITKLERLLLLKNTMGILGGMPTDKHETALEDQVRTLKEDLNNAHKELVECRHTIKQQNMALKNHKVGRSAHV